MHLNPKAAKEVNILHNFKRSCYCLVSSTENYYKNYKFIKYKPPKKCALGKNPVYLQLWLYMTYLRRCKQHPCPQTEAVLRMQNHTVGFVYCYIFRQMFYTGRHSEYSRNLLQDCKDYFLPVVFFYFKRNR